MIEFNDGGCPKCGFDNVWMQYKTNRRNEYLECECPRCRYTFNMACWDTPEAVLPDPAPSPVGDSEAENSPDPDTAAEAGERMME